MNESLAAAIASILEAGRALLTHAERWFPISGAAVSPFDYRANRDDGAMLADQLLLAIELVEFDLKVRTKGLHDAAWNIAQWCRFNRTADDPPGFKVDVSFRSSDAERIDDSSVPPLDAKYIRMLTAGIDELASLKQEIEKHGE